MLRSLDARSAVGENNGERYFGGASIMMRASASGSGGNSFSPTEACKPAQRR